VKRYLEREIERLKIEIIKVSALTFFLINSINPDNIQLIDDLSIFFNKIN